VPPLAERPEDIPELVRHFLLRFAAEEGKRIERVSAEALALLRSYRWPGNVRQLENAVFRAVVLADTEEVGVAEFPQIASQLAHAPSGTADDGLPTVQPGDETALIVGHDSVPGIADLPAPPPAYAALVLLDPAGEMRPLEDVEAEAIRFAIAHYRGQMSEVARRLRIGRSTLYRKLDVLGLASAHSGDPDPDAGSAAETAAGPSVEAL
jgi:DNA-binding NtrC family response regulator